MNAKKVDIIDTEQFRIVLLPKEDSNNTDEDNKIIRKYHNFSIRIPVEINNLLNKEKLETKTTKADIINKLLITYYADQLPAWMAIDADSNVYVDA